METVGCLLSNLQKKGMWLSHLITNPSRPAITEESVKFFSMKDEIKPLQVEQKKPVVKAAAVKKSILDDLDDLRFD